MLQANHQDSEKAIKELSQWIPPLSPISARERIEIYTNAWFWRLEESILDDYSRLEHCLGHHDFGRMLSEYLDQCPSLYHDISSVGDQLPSFIKTWNNPSNRPWLYPLALYERALYQSYFAKNPEAWQMEQLQELTPDQFEIVRFKVQKTVNLIKSDWVLKPLIQKTGSEPSIKRKTHYLVYRLGFDVYVDVISAAQHSVLCQMAQSTTLGQLIQESADPQKLIQWMTEWAQKSVILPHTGKPS